LSSPRKPFLLICLFSCLFLSVNANTAAQSTPPAQPPSSPKPATATPTPTLPPAPADYSKESVIVEKTITKIAYQNDGTDDQQSFMRVKIQSQAGIQTYGVLHFYFPSATDTMDVDFIRVIKPDGTLVSTPLDNIVEMPAEITRQAPMYSDIKDKQIAVKGLQIGDILEYQYHAKITTALAPGQFWSDQKLDRTDVVLQQELQVTLPRDRKVIVKSNTIQPTVTDQGSTKVYDWKAGNLKPEPEEKDQKKTAKTSADSKLPDIEISSFQSWDEVGQWFGKLAYPRAAVTPEIQAKATELTAKAANEDEKIQSIYNFASTKFRYISISLGIGRYQPHSAAEVLTNDYGDCKDKHTLFAALLAAAGIKADAVLIGSDEKLDPDVPSLSQFNHVITAIPQGDHYLFLDTTPEVAPFGLLITDLRDKQALLVPEHSPASLVHTPADPPFKQFYTFEANGSVSDAGVLNGTVQVTTRGDVELVYRLILRQAGPARWNDVMQNVSSNQGFGGKVSDVKSASFDNFDQPLEFQYVYDRPYSDWANDHQIYPPLPRLIPTEPPDSDNQSHDPIKLGSPMEFTSKATIKLPRNADPTLPPSLDLHESFADYRAEYSFANGTLHVERTLSTSAREISPAQVDAYRKFIKTIEDDYNASIDVFGGPPSSLASRASSGTPEAMALMMKGQQAAQSNRLSDAADYFQQAVDKDPNFALGWVALAVVQIELDYVNEGVKNAKKALELDKSNVQPYKFLVSEMRRKHLDDQALDVLRSVKSAHPDDRELTQNIGAILLDQKKYTEAIAELQPAVDRKPEDDILLLQLGEAYIRSGAKEKGAATVIKAAEMNHSDFVLNNAAYDLADNNLNLDDAHRLATEAVQKVESATAQIKLDQLNPGDAQLMPKLAYAWDTLGWVEFRLGHFESAEKYLKSAFSLSQEPTISDHLQQVYEKEGKKHEADQQSQQTGVSALQDQRTLQIKKPAAIKSHASAEFFLLFSPGPKLVDEHYISGSDELRELGKSLDGAKFKIPFPDDGPVQIVRRGVLDCEPELTYCVFVVYPPSPARSLN
jgi:tetratricopeptide (TPR) repeat protein/transglutaminase-like putative cysteine protease